MTISIERVQTGIRVEKRTLKVLKALAEYLDLSLGDLVERIVLRAFEGQAAFSADVLAQVARLREVYGLARGSQGRRSNAARSVLGATRRQASSKRSRSSAARVRERRTSTHS
jgi:predicted DNA-binding ribbon-helix-helix protein